MSIGSGTMRFGPAKLKGDARSAKTGSKRMFLPASRTSIVACPIHVTDGLVCGERSAAGSVLTEGRFQPSGGGFGSPSRIRSNCHAQKLSRPACG